VLLAERERLVTNVVNGLFAFGDEEALDPLELGMIQRHIREYNRTIAECASLRKHVHLVDINTFFNGIATNGYPIPGTTVTLRAAYNGGLFSLDGIHPSDTGSGLVADQYVAAINQEVTKNSGKANGFQGLRAPIPRPDLSKVRSSDPMGR
jgi:lysophospholipase L1-like esterase